MSNLNEIVMAVAWISDQNGNRPNITTPPGCSWTDITAQPSKNLPCAPNVYLVRAWVTDAIYTALNGDSRYLVVARRTYDDATLAESYNNLGEQPTGAQLTTLKNALIARFPGIDDDKLVLAGSAIISSGATRQQIITKLAQRWQAFLKAVT